MTTILNSTHCLYKWAHLIVAMAAINACAQAQRYTGPASLGPFRIDQNVSMASMFARLGQPPSPRGETFCYRSGKGGGYLYLTRLDPVYDDEKTAGAMVLSIARNCVRRAVQVTAVDILHWKTDKGVGLFSTEAQVLAAYGDPTKQSDVHDTNCGLPVYGDDEAASGFSSSKATHDCKLLVYKGIPEELNTAEFGIADGKVVWIMLSQNE